MELTERLESLKLGNTSTASIEALPFGILPSSHIQVGNVNRYLFRVFDEISEGFNDKIWVRSRDARLSKHNWDIDIFARQDRVNIALMLSRHLWWEGKNDEEDNLVSWSSSLLVVLQYAFYRHRHYGIDLSAIFICVVDTSKLPKNVFVQDMNLIRKFSPLNSRLARMQDLRLSKHYYGEFLSQGELRIEGHCSIVSIEDIINVGLMRLRPEFEGFETRKPAWANEVVRLRQNDTDISGLLPIDDDHVRIAMHIGELFGKRWRLPVMISCLALKPWQNIESQVMKALQQSEFEDFQTLITALEEINYLAKANLPEVMRGEKIMRMVYMNLRLDEAYLWAPSAEKKLRDVLLLLEREKLHDESLSDYILATRERFLEHLKAITECTHALHEALSN
ncbi:hypothetical protein M433DRAFT_26903 [Acidomyces richmondensis BFW]|nr:hypothetical protein M433DRAFT_26903 [Acidomyces richmondensis BFW]